jgi:hypothetical protein
VGTCAARTDVIGTYVAIGRASTGVIDVRTDITRTGVVGTGVAVVAVGTGGRTGATTIPGSASGVTGPRRALVVGSTHASVRKLGATTVTRTILSGAARVARVHAAATGRARVRAVTIDTVVAGNAIGGKHAARGPIAARIVRIARVRRANITVITRGIIRRMRAPACGNAAILRTRLAVVTAYGRTAVAGAIGTGCAGRTRVTVVASAGLITMVILGAAGIIAYPGATRARITRVIASARGTVTGIGAVAIKIVITRFRRVVVLQRGRAYRRIAVLA